MACQSALLGCSVGKSGKLCDRSLPSKLGPANRDFFGKITHLVAFWNVSVWTIIVLAFAEQLLSRLYLIRLPFSYFLIPWKKSSSRDRMNALSSEITAHWVPHWAHDTRAFYKGQNAETKRERRQKQKDEDGKKPVGKKCWTKGWDR